MISSLFLFRLCFLRHFHLTLSKAFFFSLCAIPCLQEQQHYMTSTWERGALRDPDSDVAAEALHLAEAWHLLDRPKGVKTLTSQPSESPVLTEKRKMKQPCMHTRQKCGHAEKPSLPLCNLSTWVTVCL